jgi:hypothetical protein
VRLAARAVEIRKATLASILRKSRTGVRLKASEAPRRPGGLPARLQEGWKELFLSAWEVSGLAAPVFMEGNATLAEKGR